MLATIAERIKQGLEMTGKKQADLERATGISKGALSSYLKGKYEPKQANIFLISKALGVDPAWLMGRDVRPNGSSISRGIPIYSELSCGKGSLTDELPVGEVALPPYLMPSGKAFGNVAQGNSMEPTIHEGDLLIFQETPEVESGQIGSFSLNGKYFCKRFKKYSDGSCWLFSDNPEYPPIPIKPEDDFRTLGLYKMKLSEEQ